MTSIYRALHLFFQDTKDDLVQGLGLLHRAIDEDPGFALARALAAGLIARGVLVRWLPRILIKSWLAKSALRDGMDDAEVLAWAGWALSYLSDERSLGHAAVEKAMTLNPNSPTVLLAGAASAIYMNRPGDSRDRLLRGMRLSPLEPRMQIFSRTSWTPRSISATPSRDWHTPASVSKRTLAGTMCMAL